MKKRKDRIRAEPAIDRVTGKSMKHAESPSMEEQVDEQITLLRHCDLRAVCQD